MESDKNFKLPPHWIKKESKSRGGKMYFFNTITQKSVWTSQEVKDAEENSSASREQQVPDNKSNSNAITSRNESHAIHRYKNSKVAQKPETHFPESTNNSDHNSIMDKSANNLDRNKFKRATETNNNNNNATKVSTKTSRLDPRARAKKREELKRQAEDNLHKVKQTTRMKAKPGSETNQLSKDKVKKVELFLQSDAIPSTSLTAPVSLQSIDSNKRQSVNDRLNKFKKLPTAETKVPSKNPTNSNYNTDNVKKQSETVPLVKNSVAPSYNDDDIEMEPMDWEELPEEYILKEIESLRQQEMNQLTSQDDEEMTPVNPPSSNDANPLLDLSKFETMEQYLNYKNLLNADEFDAKYFYVVVDTNVFISNLSLIENLPKTLFKKSGYPIIVIPYIVLQELDRLKNRRSDNLLSSKAQAAIHLLQEKLKDGSFQGQSSQNHANELIKIETPDDNILNCVLQLQKTNANVLLLSNDVNLRNKTMVSSVEACSSKQLDDLKDTLEFL